jgi:D-amino peptidase
MDKPTMTMLRPLFALAAVVALSSPAAAQRPIKVFLSVDMEGITGVVTGEQLGPSGFEYQRFREFMTADALAAIEGARAAGATEFVVADSHGNMQNLLLERFPADVTIVRGSPRRLSMMQGVDSTVSAVMFIGYHSATTNPNGVRAHTMSSATFAAVEINGVAQSESSINAAIAGYFGVPIVLVSGDESAVGEVQRLVGDVEGAIVKRSLGFHSAATMTPQAGQALIRAKAKAAIERLRDFRPHSTAGPYTLDLTYKNYTAAEAMAMLPGVERRTAHAVRYGSRSLIDIVRFLSFATTYRSDLTP